jgi:hypothetical protein
VEEAGAGLPIIDGNSGGDDIWLRASSVCRAVGDVFLVAFGLELTPFVICPSRPKPEPERGVSFGPFSSAFGEGEGIGERGARFTDSLGGKRRTLPPGISIGTWFIFCEVEAKPMSASTMSARPIREENHDRI